MYTNRQDLINECRAEEKMSMKNLNLPSNQPIQKRKDPEVDHQDIIQFLAESQRAEVKFECADNDRKRRKTCKTQTQIDKSSTVTDVSATKLKNRTPKELNNVKGILQDPDSNRLSKTIETATQTEVQEKPKNTKARGTQMYTETESKHTNVNQPLGILAYDILAGNPKSFKLLVGFPVEKFQSFCDFIEIDKIEHCAGVDFLKLTRKEELLIVLVKIRRGYTFQELSFFARMDVRFVIQIFNKWMDFMYRQLFGVCVDMNQIVDKEDVQNLTKNLEKVIYTYRAGAVLH